LLPCGCAKSLRYFAQILRVTHLKSLEEASAQACVSARAFSTLGYATADPLPVQLEHPVAE